MGGSRDRFKASMASSLSGSERIVLELFYADRLTRAEIAAVLGVAEDRVAAMLEGLRGRARGIVTGGARAMAG